VNSKILITKPTTSFFSKRKKEKEKVKFWFTSTYIFMISVISCLLFYYVWILNVNATKWFSIRTLWDANRELEAELVELKTKIAEIESIKVIETTGGAENMEKIEDPDYLVIRDSVQYVYNN